MKYAICFLFTPNGKKILMARTKNGRLNGLSEKVKQDETPIHAALREIHTKTGVELKLSELHWLATTCLPISDTKTRELHFYAAIIDQAHVNLNAGENLTWEDTDWVMHARPQDERLAGEGEIAYLVNKAVNMLGFNIQSVSIFYNILIGEDGDDYLYAEKVPSHELVDTRDKIKSMLKPSAYVKIVPYN